MRLHNGMYPDMEVTYIVLLSQHTKHMTANTVIVKVIDKSNGTSQGNQKSSRNRRVLLSAALTVVTECTAHSTSNVNL